jgi:hypothetical protein
MSELSQPVPYRVAYAERVREGLRELGERAKIRGLGRAFLAALKDLDRRLGIYPQFGEPLYDLKLEPGQVWIGAIPPLMVRYDLDEQRRQVTVVSPFTPLPGSGLEP